MTTTDGCAQLIDDLVTQIKHRVSSESVTSACALQTPFLYPDNTPISVYVYKENGSLVVSDHGQASDYVFENGVGSGTVNSRLKKAERRFGLTNDGDELRVETDASHLADAVLAIVGAVQDIGYLIYRQSRPQQHRQFRSDVERFLVLNGRPYERDVVVTRSPRVRKADYRVTGDQARQLYLWILDPSTRHAAEEKADDIALSVFDLREQMEALSERIAVLVNTQHHDQNSPLLSTALAALRHYQVPNVAPWENRHEIELLVAA